jgi:hypothetical protein
MPLAGGFYELLFSRCKQPGVSSCQGAKEAKLGKEESRMTCPVAAIGSEVSEKPIKTKGRSRRLNGDRLVA